MKDLIANAQTQPRGVLYGAACVGSAVHMQVATVAQLEKNKADHLASPGTSETANDDMAMRPKPLR